LMRIQTCKCLTMNIASHRDSSTTLRCSSSKFMFRYVRVVVREPKKLILLIKYFYVLSSCMTWCILKLLS
jgi:hypothetical protein